MIAENIQNALNRQINEDYSSWYFYRSAAAYCRQMDLRGLEKWLRHRSQKKLDRATGVSDFLLERRGQVDFQPITPPNNHWGSPRSILDAALEQERHLGESVARLIDLSLSQGDHATHDLLERFASDQAEAEAKVEALSERLKLAGDEPPGLFIFDRMLA